MVAMPVRHCLEATRKRWAAFREGNAEAEKPAEQKRKISAAARKAMGEAIKQRRDAFHKAQKAAGPKYNTEDVGEEGCDTGDYIEAVKYSSDDVFNTIGPPKAGTTVSR